MTNDEIAKHYDKSCLENKEAWKAAQWFTEEDAYMNYSIMSSLTAPEDSVLDVGCGQGGLYDILASRFSNLRYHGIDISKEMIARASKAKPNVLFTNGDFLSEEIEQVNKVFAIGAFSFRSEGDQYEYLRRCLQRCYDLCKNKAAATLTTIQADIRFDGSELFYYCPIEVHKIVSSITPYYTINTMSISCEMIVVMAKIS